MLYVQCWNFSEGYIIGDFKYLLTSVSYLLSRILLQSSSSQPAIACSKLTIETLEEGVKYVQS